MADLRNFTRQQVGKTIFLLVLSFAGAGFLWEMPHRQIDPFRKYMTAKEQIDAETAARVGWIQLASGLFVAFGAFTTWKNLQENQRKNQLDAAHAERNFQALLAKQTKDTEQAKKSLKELQDKNTADSFRKAVEMLGHDNLDIRLGGIFALEQISNTEDAYYWQIMEILTAYVRNRSPIDTSSLGVGIHTDIQAVMLVLGRRKYINFEGQKFHLDLSGTNLRGLQLHDAQLQNINFKESDLQNSKLKSSNLKGAIFDEANLTNVEFWYSNLQNASFLKSQVKGTEFILATLDNADFRLRPWSDDDRGNVDDLDLDTINLTLSQIQLAKSFQNAMLPRNIEAQLNQIGV